MARLVVDPAFVVGALDRRLFGSFVEHMGRCVYTGIYEPGHATADADGFRQDVLDLVRELGVTIVRYPGGNFVSSYDWEDGVGPKDRRPRRLDLAWRAIEPNQFGTDEFVAWSRKAEIEPMLAVNLGTRGIGEAVDLLEYCNLPAGTELSDRRVANGARNRTASRCGAWATRWTVPGRSVTRPPRSTGGWPRRPRTPCGGSSPGSNWSRAARATPACRPSANGSASSWNTPTTSSITSACTRTTNRTTVTRRASWPPSEEMDRMISEVVATADHVKALKRSDKEINLSFDEWNVWYQQHFPGELGLDIREAGPLIEDSYTVDAAVVVGSLLITLLRHADRVKIACLAQLVNVIAPIRTEPGGRAWRQTIFHPFALTARYAGPTVLQTAVTGGPEIDTARFGRIPALWSTATYDEKTGETAIFVVNRSETDKVDLEIPLGLRLIEHVALYDDDRFAVNTADDPDRVVPRAIDGTEVVNGTCTATLPPASWHLIRLHR